MNGLVRFRTRDGRYLSGIAGGLDTLKVRPGPPTAAETFMFGAGTSQLPLTDGGFFEVVVPGPAGPTSFGWTIFPHTETGFGGPGVNSEVCVSDYRGPAPFRHVFGVVVSGGEVSIIVPGPSNDWFFQVDADNFVRVVGTAPFLDNTAFIVELPPFCAAVTGYVRDATSMLPITGATVVTDGGFTSTTDETGRFALEDEAEATCVPEGAHILTATEECHRSERQVIVVPAKGTVDTVIQLACTVVAGFVEQFVDDKLVRVPGVEVTLIYKDLGGGMVVTTDPDGGFQFVCVRRTRVQVQTDDTGAQDVNEGNPIPDTGVVGEIICVPGPDTPCPVITGTVTEATTGAPIAGATVTVQGTVPGALTAKTDASGRYTITNVCLIGFQSVKASATGYASDVLSTGILPSFGTVIVDIKLKKLQRMLKV
jgi:hypothetical protein